MYPPEYKDRFIELRAQGLSYARIATELGICKNTVVEWSRRFRFDINNLRAIELDDLQTRILGSVQSRVTSLSEKLAKLEDELAKRDLTRVSTSRLFSMVDSVKRQIAHEAQSVRFASPLDDIPENEYVEKCQEWNA